MKFEKRNKYSINNKSIKKLKIKINKKELYKGHDEDFDPN